MKKRKQWLCSIVIFAMILGLFIHPEIVKADTASVTFGSESYAAESNGEFMVGVYINGESRVGTYHVEIAYDANRIEYIGGAEQGGDGTIILEGTGTRQEIKYMLSFRTLSGGEAYIRVNGAVINMADSVNAEKFEITELDSAFINISGADTVGDVTEEDTGFFTTLPHLSAAIMMNETEYYMLDLTQMMPGDIYWDYEIAELTFLEQKVTFLTDVERNVYFAYLFDETEQMTCYAYNPEQNMFYPCEVYQSGDNHYYYTSALACANWPTELTLDAVKEQNVVFAIDTSGKGQFSRLDEEGNLVEWDAAGAQQSLNSQNNKLIWILGIAGVVIIIVLIGAFFTTRELERKRRNVDKERRLAKVRAMEDIEITNLSQDEEELVSVEPSRKEKPVISVKDVTMRFKVATSNVSGIKEYIIQLLKKEISYRELLALNHVSFDIYKGEVVGIIGTNGSGKSTLLRIVSGALDPTEGEVLVNRKKLQLLTLGTGFDTELTAKENVYLNGAIIGYTEEFINEHYDEIVKFAELEGFMEEKVKNFSSGMVSRLGFAIATVGEASDILILDEVLSVGDEFFQKKSLARIKEMIHGGSTVLMVSHSMNTILTNCTKVVWIERGVLKMVGDPKVVCAAYQKQFEAKDEKPKEIVKNGLWLEDGVWYLYKNGEIDKESSLARNKHGWWYVHDGKIDFTFTGLATNENGTWFMRRGRLDTSFSGDFEFEGKMYKVVNGKVRE